MGASSEVDKFLTDLEHPQLKAIQLVRKIILGADRRITEGIKWKSPTFMYKGNIASIDPRSKKHVSLMFHQGAVLPGKHRLLEGGGETVRYMRFADVDEVKKHRSDIEKAVKAWCEMKAGSA